MPQAMIVLFTDFGLEGPYVGQVKAVLCVEAPGVPVIDLLHDAPAHRPELAAYLLAAYAPAFPQGSVFLCVVDPGVGAAERRPVVLRADGRWYVGPDNGLFDIVARRADAHDWWEITDRPARLSASFHGRDLFAPVAARLAREGRPGGEPCERIARDGPDDLPCIVYIDRFGNAVTGLRAAVLADEAVLEAGGRRLKRARTFADVPAGAPFWYENANGLVEIAANRAPAAEILGLGLGAPVVVHQPAGEGQGHYGRR